MISGSRQRLSARLPVVAASCLGAVCLAGSCAFPRTPFFPAPQIHEARPFDGIPVTNRDYDFDGDLRPEFRKQDLDGDGVVDRYLKDLDGDGTFDLSIPKAPEADRALRHLIICVDSVPFSVMDALWRQGRFRDFYPPGRVISTFPSDTNPAFADLFGMEKTPGIENRYFDRLRNRVVGGAWDHMVRRTGATFHAAFDYEQHPRYGALIYLAPYAVADHDLARCRAVFRRLLREKPADRPILLYIGSTDALAHREGREGLTRHLLMLERMLDEIIFETAGEVRISLFSDHGNNLVPSGQLVDLQRHLSRNGFRVAGSLRSPRDVVVPRFGLVGVACLYTRKENRAEVAQALTSLKGVDYSVYENDGACIVEGARGKAVISRNGRRYRYEMLSGDPLSLGGIVAEMQRRGELDKQGYADDAAWFEATGLHVYPDILRRLSDAVENHVVNRPDVFVSLEDGYCYGSGFFVNMIALRGTHGSANAAQTNGMAMSTDRPVPGVIRAEEMMTALGAVRPGGPPASPIGAAPAEPPDAEPRREPENPAPPVTTATPAPTATPTAEPTPTPTAVPTSTCTPMPQPSSTPTAPPPTATVSPATRTPAPTRTRRPRVRALRRTPLPRRTMPARVPPPQGDVRSQPE